MIYTVPGTGFAQLLVNAGDGPTMVINRDETHQLFVGDDNSVASKNGTGDIDIIDPLSFIVYDGIDPKYGISDTPGISIQVNTVKGATQWAPSPAQAAFQISQLGLATASNQGTQIGQATTTQNTLVSGIGLPINAAQETGGHLSNTDTNTSNTNNSISTGTNPLLQGTTVPSAFIDIAGQTIADMITSRVNLLPNGDFRRGFAGWSVTNCTETTPQTGLPTDFPRNRACLAVPTGSANTLQLNGPLVPCQPNQPVAVRAWVHQNAQNVSEFVTLNLRFQTAALVTISTVVSTKQVPSGTTGHLDVAAIAPAGTAIVRVLVTYSGQGASNIPATDTFYVGDITLHSGQVGGMPSTAQDIAANAVDPNTLVASATSTLAVSSSVTDGPILINQPSFELYINAQYNNASPGNSALTITLTWTDSVSGLLLEQEDYAILPGASTGTTHIVTIKGPTKANTVTVKYSNTDLIGGVVLTRALFSNARTTYLRSVAKTQNTPNLPGNSAYFSAIGDCSANVIGDRVETSLPANNSEFALLGMYNGTCTLTLGSNITLGVATIFGIQIFDIVEQAAANPVPLLSEKQDANGQLMLQFALPRKQCVCNITNLTASAREYTLKVVANEEGT